jgi:predicted RND superfamily exporter protein
MNIEYQKYIDVIDRWIINRNKTVILGFLVLTLVMSVGLGMTATDSGTSQFTEGVPAQEAFEDVNDNFERQPFSEGTGSTTLIQQDRNVLAKSSLISMLRAQNRLEQRTSQHVVGSNSFAQIVGRVAKRSRLCRWYSQLRGHS